MKKTLIWLINLMIIISMFSACVKEKYLTEVTVENCKKSINILDYGIVANSLDSAKANTKALNRLINSCAEGTAIYFPNNKYYFESDNGCIKINYKNSLLFYGDNAVIINTSFDPTVEINEENYHNSMTVSLHNSKNIRIEGLRFDYYHYTQVCGKVVEKNIGVTAIEIDQRFLNSSEKPAITGKEIASAVAVLDENGATIGDYYANGKYNCWLHENIFYVVGGEFGNIGAEAVVRFNISTAPEFYAQETENLTIHNVQSYSSPAAAFLMSGEGNANFNFSNVTIAPPEDAVWRWGSNVDGIFINCMRGEVNVRNCKFYGMGDDALNVHSTAAKVASVDGNEITLNYAYNNHSVSSSWAKVGDIIKFYKSDFSICAKAKIKKRSLLKITLEIMEGSVSVGDFAENESLSPKVNVENVTVDGGRARAFLIQTDNVTIKNCNISNLGLAGIIISPDINKWYEMGPAENISISNCKFTNVCAMGGDNCKGAIFSSSSHNGALTNEIIHKNIEISHNVFSDISVPAINLTSVDGVIIKDNIYPENIENVISNCINVIEE